MGTTFDLYALSPSRLARLSTSFEQELPASAADLRALCEAEHSTLDDGVAENWETASPRERKGMFVDVVLRLSTEKHWDLDKALGDHALGSVFRDIPELRKLPLRTFGRTDVVLPAVSVPDFGWSGIWSAEAVERWPVEVEQFAHRVQVQRYEPARAGLWGRLTGADEKARAAVKRWLEEYNWESWCDIVAAVQYTKAHRTHLALRFFM